MLSTFEFAIHPYPGAGLVDLLILWAITYVVLMAIYFGLGLVFDGLNRQHPERRIQSRPQKNQIAMEMRTSVIALVSISFYVSFGLFAQAKGWTMAPLELSWWSGPLMLAISLMLYDTWFYWGHRLMHTKMFYRWHSHHHRSIVPSPWANNSDTQVGAFVEQFYWVVLPFILPIPPEIIIAHKIFDQVTGIAGHAGHEYFAAPSNRSPFPLLCTTFHDQHHGHFNYNYANTFSWWDRVMGTIHPKYDEVVERFEQMPPPTVPPRRSADGQKTGGLSPGE
ncbi:MAG: sterol desaturase family protein [Hyphomicrobium aestuarii]|nr:sterol desaturase family protein [Hyphomicrobium aestuarii]